MVELVLLGPADVGEVCGCRRFQEPALLDLLGVLLVAVVCELGFHGGGADLNVVEATAEAQLTLLPLWVEFNDFDRQVYTRLWFELEAVGRASTRLDPGYVLVDVHHIGEAGNLENGWGLPPFQL